ncbi:hypothetical protein [Rhizobium sp. Root1220]|uniref:hypothetical protein n=1 Tax=Rhizobium sp. Root1220 TaxID=1736432 RepID=UPI0006F934E4|nr:hypothetical protein [Rhizobium sp. Root1220]KQV63778.1 hypothetical protein ASC90_17520 [Rhizobium sp. Root1220]
MKINSSVSGTYGLTSLFGQSGQRSKQQAIELDSGVRQSGAGLQSSTTPPSISSTMWALQSGASTKMDGSSDDAANADHDALVSEFSDMVNMTPAEWIRAKILEKMGRSEDELKSMAPEERQAIEKQIADEIKRQVTGGDDKDTSATDDIPTL